MESGKMPPKTHDLLYLAKLASLSVPEEHMPILMHLNQVSVPTRYPENIGNLTQIYNNLIASKYLKETKELLKWLKKEVK